MFQKYESFLQTIKPTQQEQQIIEKVKAGIYSDSQKSPWDSNKWYMTFADKNKTNTFYLIDAPKGKLLMVVTSSLGTLYSNRGTQVVRGSIIVKLEDNLIYCLDGKSWAITERNTAVTFNIGGFFTFEGKQNPYSLIYGAVKEIKNVRV